FVFVLSPVNMSGGLPISLLLVCPPPGAPPPGAPGNPPPGNPPPPPPGNSLPPPKALCVGNIPGCPCPWNPCNGCIRGGTAGGSPASLGGSPLLESIALFSAATSCSSRCPVCGFIGATVATSTSSIVAVAMG